MPSAHQPFPLTDRGEQQARDAAQALNAELVSNDWAIEPVIDSSHMLRAWQTARIISTGLPGVEALRIESFDALAERSVGCAANLSLQQIEAVLRDDPRVSVHTPWQHCNGESATV